MANTPSLIPGLPLDPAQNCLARVPWNCQTKLKAVCKTWAEYLTSSDICVVRSQEGLSDSLLLVVSVPVKLGSLKLSVYDAAQVTALEWKNPLAVFEFPGKWGGFLRGFRCAVVGPNLLIIGGRHNGVTSNRVTRFNFITKKWTEAASMNVGRREFACAVVNGVVYVAGGTDSVSVLPQGRGTPTALNSVEVYDDAHDQWHQLPPLNKARVGCLGVALNERFYVIGGGSDHGTVEFEMFRSAEVFDTVHCRWKFVNDMWQSAAKLPRAVAGFADSMFAVDSNDKRLKRYDEVANRWDDVMPMPYSNTVLPGKNGHAERQQALGGLPGDQLLDFTPEGLFWMGPCSYLTQAHHLLRLGESESGKFGTDEDAAPLASGEAAAALRNDTGGQIPDCRDSESQREERRLCLIIGSGVVYI